jgi:hypothetical protein
MSFRTWIEDALFPKKTCAREGYHIRKIERRKTFRRPKNPDQYAVADACTEKRTVCARCGAVLNEWKIVARHPAPDANIRLTRRHRAALHKNGYILR